MAFRFFPVNTTLIFFFITVITLFKSKFLCNFGSLFCQDLLIAIKLIFRDHQVFFENFTRKRWRIHTFFDRYLRGTSLKGIQRSLHDLFKFSASKLRNLGSFEFAEALAESFFTNVSHFDNL